MGWSGMLCGLVRILWAPSTVWNDFQSSAGEGTPCLNPESLAAVNLRLFIHTLRGLILLLVCSALPVQAQQEVEVSLFEGGEGLGFYSKVAEDYQRQRPSIKVRLEGDPRMAEKLRIRVLEGSLPEVTNADIDIWSLVEHGDVQPLDEWLDGPSWDGETTWRDSFLPGSLEQYQYKGKTYGVPLVYVVWSVYYDKSLFEAQGWGAPGTWDEFKSLCDKIRSQGRAPMAFQGRYPFYAQALLRHLYFHLAGRQAYLSQQRGEIGSFDNPEMIQALGQVSELSQKHFQSGALGMSHTEAQLEFFQGRAGMLMCGSWLFSEMQDNIPEGFRLGAFPLPLPRAEAAEPQASYATSGYFFVMKSAKNPVGGVDFLRYLTSREVAGRFAQERGITVAIDGGNAQLHSQMADVSKQLRETKSTFGTAPGAGLKGLDLVWTDALGRLLSGKGEPAELARDMESRVEVLRKTAATPDRITIRHRWKSFGLMSFLVLGLLLGVRSRKGQAEGLVEMSRGNVWAFLIPSLAIYSVFLMLPSLAALLASLVRWNGISSPEFVGLLHFKRLLLESDAFWQALFNNLFLMVVVPAFVLPLALFLAYSLHKEVPGSRWFRICFFFPNLLGVAGVILWQQLYNPQGGPINKLLVALGFGQFEGFAWLSTETLTFSVLGWEILSMSHLYWALIPMGIWGAAGFNMVLFLAAMQSVPESLYEAASINGAKEWQKFRYITLPMIKETLIAATIFMIIGGMKAFEAIWLLTNQSPSTDTHVVGTLMVRSMFVEQRIGQAAAIACLLFSLILVGSLLTSKASADDE